MENAALQIEQLLQFGLRHGLIGPSDVYVARNALLDLFGLSEPYDSTQSGALPEPPPDTPAELLEPLLDEAARRGLFDGEVPALRVNFEARVMGALMPRQSEVEARFYALWQSRGVRAATDYFYDLCIQSNYIRTAQIAKNIQWTYPCQYGALEITINLTKPEKDPKTIALERLQPASGYPKCMLCIENIGYAGRMNFPARQNHRVVPITLCGEQWYLQYSPYVYYNEHCIVFAHEHAPMRITPDTFAQLFDFVRQFPHYTCGSNADLPIVGGSILSHMHFQGGNYTFPMQRAKTLRRYRHPDYPQLAIETLRWPVSTVRVTGEDAGAMQRFAGALLTAWRGYSDESADILAFTEEDGRAVPHNTVTPILHREEGRGYVLDLVPRNNRATERHPEGIFHPHREIHHIKKENIGLIEVMGLAILPSRLKRQSEDIARVLTGELDAAACREKAPEHAEWLAFLTEKYGASLAPDAAREAVRREIGAKFETCLEHAGVFKQTPEGIAAFGRFLSALGCAEQV